MVYAVEDKRRNTSTNELKQLIVCSFLCNVIIVILSYIFYEFWLQDSQTKENNLVK